MKRIGVVIWWPAGQGDFNIGIIERGICRFFFFFLPTWAAALFTDCYCNSNSNNNNNNNNNSLPCFCAEVPNDDQIFRSFLVEAEVRSR